MNNGAETFTAERIAELRKNIDFSDIPEITNEDFTEGTLRNWKPMKKAISMRIDLDNLEWLKRKGSGYQKRMNDVIRWARNNGCPLA